MKDIDFLNHEPYFNPKTACVSICKSNIKNKESIYYARVCKTGNVNIDALLSILKTKSTQVDVELMKANLLKMKEIIIELACEGKSVDLFGLGTFSLGCGGKIELKEGMKQYVENSFSLNNDNDKNDVSPAKSDSYKDEYIENRNADFDISKAIKTRLKFQLKFTPSQYCKKKIEDVKMAIAIKKRRSPVIKEIEDITPKNLISSISIIKVKGDALKVVGEKPQVGIYMEKENGEMVKIEKDNIIENTPKKLVILLQHRLKNTHRLKLSIITQYAKMGSNCSTTLLRGTSREFMWKARTHLAMKRKKVV